MFEFIVVITIVIILGFTLLLNMYKNANTDYVDKRVIVDKHFPQSFGQVKIFFISDIHKRLINNKTIKDVSSGAIDLVIIGGDLCEKGVPLTQVTENIKRLKGLNVPIYFIWGNNDYETDYHDLDAMLLDQNVNIIANSAVNFESSDGDIFSLLGFDCMKHRSVQAQYAFEDAKGTYKILATHDPKAFEELKHSYKEEVNFVLSGHTHGGQIRFLGWGLYPKGGLKQTGKTLVFVSEGYGTTRFPLRLGTRAECHLITLTNQLT